MTANMKKTRKTIYIIVLVAGILVIGLVLVNSKEKAEQVAGPIMEKCWNNETIEIVSLTSRPSFRKGFNWRVGAKYTEEGFPAVLENPEYGYAPEILVNMFTRDIVWKHFQEIGDASEGCGNN